MRLSDYMQACLLHPEHGYYTTRPPFGAKGDFITAPEISQMFGELIGLALAQHWLEGGQPSRFTLAELGPGRGTLMADILRATRKVPGFHAAMDLVLVEASPALRQTQAQAIAPHQARWLMSASELPEQPLFVVANEFFDALPIRQFTRTRAGWRETVVGLVDGRLTPGLSPELPAQMLAEILAHRSDLMPGDVVEHCPALAGITAQIAGRVARHGGLALILDYGTWRGRGDSFQALRHHSPVSPYDQPGHADLTAHVDFAEISRAALQSAGNVSSRYTTQGRFLQALGIGARAQALARNLSGPALEQHLAAFHRLTDPGEMGDLFKVIALTRQGAPLPAGFPDA